MADVAKEHGKQIDIQKIEEKLGIPVMLFSATDLTAYDKFYETLGRALKEQPHIQLSALEEEYRKIEGYSDICDTLSDTEFSGYTPMWLTVKVLEQDRVVSAKLKNALPDEKYRQIEALTKGSAGAVATGQCKFAWIDEMLDGAVNETKTKSALGRLDRIYTHRFWGKPAVVLTVILGLLASFIPALPLMAVGSALTMLKAPVGEGLTSLGAPDFLTGLVCDVCIQSLSYVMQMLGFVFGVTLVFGLLEEVGVMARISYVFDNTMGKLGLQGKSVMPFLVSFGCTMGGAAGARVIDNWGQKVLTIALAWAIPCGAAWAIIPMLSTVFFGASAPLVIVLLLLTMIFHMWITAKLFSRGLVRQEDKCGMIMELPPYHKPKWGALMRYVFGRTKDTFFRVTKVVLLVCAVFWLLSYSTGAGDNSILQKFGMAIEPVTKFFGMPWQLFLAFIASSVGKEGAVGVISALYSGGSYGAAFTAAMSGAETAANLNELLLANVTRPEALAFIFAITFNMPCIVALAATYQEIHSVKWTAKIALYYTASALLLSCIVYHIGLLIW
jgi:ferrous iron transport protein B